MPKGYRERYDTPELREIALRNLILKVQVGSGLHGIAIADTDDRDEMGIAVEPPSHVIGPGEFTMYKYRSAPERASHDDLCKRSDEHDAASCLAVEWARSGAGDIDLDVHSLRKWMRLALAGHPTIILPLFAPASEVMHIDGHGLQLRALASSIISRQAGDRFRGYLAMQRRGLERNGRGKKSNRPELIARYGFDVKYAAHMIRIALQGSELMTTGQITLPVPSPFREELIALRRGEMPLGHVLAWAQGCERRLARDVEFSPLPRWPASDVCWAWVRETYRRHWEEHAA